MSRRKTVYDYLADIAAKARRVQAESGGDPAYSRWAKEELGRAVARALNALQLRPKRKKGKS